MKKIVVACDSFKGSCDSATVAAAVRRGVLSVFDRCDVRCIEIGDGGEGTCGALVGSLGAQWVEAVVHDPLMRPITARYGVGQGERTAVIEIAAASGLTLLSLDERNACKTSSYGAGELILDAYNRGCRRFFVGIGGSATSDAGVGMLSALGFRFLDSMGREVSGRGECLSLICSIDRSGGQHIVDQCEFIVGCDVNNSLTGEFGAAYVFAPQKGASPSMVALLDAGLRNFARVLSLCGYPDVESSSGAGAAGGIGAAFKAILGGRLVSGIDMVLEAIEFDRELDDCDLVISGEGRMDGQSIGGKAPFGVLRAAQGRGVDVVAIVGSVEDSVALEREGFRAIFPICSSPISLSEAMDLLTTSHNIERTVRQVMRIVTLGRG